MDKTLKYLKGKEWSMGCGGRDNTGQCPDCCGSHESSLGHPCHLTADTLGHKKGCELAEMLEEFGVKPLYLGESKLTDKYYNIISDKGFMMTSIVGTKLEERQRQLDANKEFEDKLYFANSILRKER